MVASASKNGQDCRGRPRALSLSQQMTSKREFYARRIEKVLRHIGEHLDEDLSIDRLSRVAGFSPFHFHRQFREFTGISVARFIALLRLKQASLQLAFAPGERVLDVALDAGFESPESFARAFRKTQGQSPSQFRKAPQWERWSEVFRNPINTRSQTMDVRIVQFEETRVAALEHRGPPEMLMASVQRFIAWRKSCDVSPESTSKTIGVPYGDPSNTAPEDFRFDICGSTLVDVAANEYGIVEKAIPGGRCAVVQHIGSTDAIGKTVHQLYGQWLPDSGEELRDFPCYFHYIKRMPTVPEHEQVTDVYLPLR